MTPTSPGEDATRVADDLLALLRARLDAPALAYAEPPAPIEGGYDTAVYSLRLEGIDPTSTAEDFVGPLILRCFRDDRGAVRARRETAVQNLVAGLGYPCPRVRLRGDDATVDGAHFTLMERVPGDRMVDGLLRLSPAALGVPVLMGELHARLHDIDPAPLLDGAAEGGIEPDTLTLDASLERMEERAEDLRAPDAQQGIRWLRERRPPDPSRLAVCHGDFHPLNILMQDGEPTGVIDWANIRVAHPMYDVAQTAIIGWHAPLDVGQPFALVFRLLRRLLVARYLAGYRRVRPFDRDAYRYYLAFNALALYLEGQHGRRSTVRTGAGAWALPGVPEGLAGRFRAITGIALHPEGAA